MYTIPYSSPAAPPEKCTAVLELKEGAASARERPEHWRVRAPRPSAHRRDAHLEGSMDAKNPANAAPCTTHYLCPLAANAREHAAQLAELRAAVLADRLPGLKRSQHPRRRAQTVIASRTHTRAPAQSCKKIPVPTSRADLRHILSGRSASSPSGGRATG
jgi:hypothetical protein